MRRSGPNPFQPDLFVYMEPRSLRFLRFLRFPLPPPTRSRQCLIQMETAWLAARLCRTPYRVRGESPGAIGAALLATRWNTPLPLVFPLFSTVSAAE